jgi:hypothetical protein
LQQLLQVLSGFDGDFRQCVAAFDDVLVRLRNFILWDRLLFWWYFLRQVKIIGCLKIEADFAAAHFCPPKIKSSYIDYRQFMQIVSYFCNKK